MREAPALAGVSDRRPGSPRPRRSRAPDPKRRWHASLLGRAFAKPGVTIAGAAFAALMAGIVGNAILFQKGHRPAPLFGLGGEAQTTPVKVVPLPPRTDAEDTAPPAGAPAAASSPAPTAAVDPTPPPAAAPHGPKAGVSDPPHAKAAAKGHVDLIGGLIGKLDERPGMRPPSQKPAGTASGARKAVASRPDPGVARPTPTPQN